MTAQQPEHWKNKILEIVLRHGREAITIVDREGRFLFLNDSAARVMRGAPKDFIGKKVADILPPQLSTQRMESTRRVLESLQPLETTTAVEMFGETRWFHSRLEPFQDDEGNYNLVLGMTQDVTEFKRAQQSLLEVEQRYRLITENMRETIWVLDMNFNLIYVSPSGSRILGYEDDPLDPQEIVRSITPHSRQIASDIVRREITPERLQNPNIKIAFDIETEHTRADGSTVWVESSVVVARDSAGQPSVILGLARDITDRKRADEQVQRHIRRISALRQIDAMISANLDLPISLNILLDHVLRELEVDAAQIMLYNPNTFMLEVVARKGFKLPLGRGNLRTVSAAFAGRAILERQTLQVTDLPTFPARASIISPGDDEGFQSYLAVPLIAKGEVKGVMEMFSKSILLPDEEWRNFMETLAGQAAIAIDNVTLFRNLQQANRDLSQAYDTTLEGWSRALELRDQETEGHTRRVTQLTERLAIALDVSGIELAHIRRGALLHDIGKMGIPDSILHKTEPLTDEDWEIIKQHPITSYNLLKEIEFLKPALDIPYCHHEKWDGTGYPRGLKGEEIPLAARIFTIIDVWDAITNDRVYRAAWPKKKALEYIRNQSGKYFDPRIVEVFIQLVNTGSLDQPNTP
ncbi:MAG: HD domain-containing phosphohydrolase [Anaerolineales bacterium]